MPVFFNKQKSCTGRDSTNISIENKLDCYCAVRRQKTVADGNKVGMWNMDDVRNIVILRHMEYTQNMNIFMYYIGGSFWFISFH